jgi:hypothetical protein
LKIKSNTPLPTLQFIAPPLAIAHNACPQRGEIAGSKRLWFFQALAFNPEGVQKTPPGFYHSGGFCFYPPVADFGWK